MIRVFSLLLFCLLSAPLQALSQSRASGAGFDLTATGGIRFLSETGRYEASGEVQLVVGTWVVLADSVVAALDDAQSQIASLTAEGTVFVQNETFKARADQLDLRFVNPRVRLLGTPVSVQMGTERLATEGPLIYDIEAGSLSMPQAFVMQVEGAVITGGEARLLLENGRMEALAVAGGVDVQRDDFRAAAETLYYAPDLGILMLKGAVVLQSGDILLSGASASFDLSTGAVELSNDSDQRVSGALRSQ